MANCNLSKEKFVEIMDAIKEYKRKIENIEKVLRDNCEDSIYCPPSLEYVLVDLLKTIFKDDGEIIDYFIYELDMGEKWVPGSVTEDIKTSNGEIQRIDCQLQTPEDLYIYLEQEHKKKEVTKNDNNSEKRSWNMEVDTCNKCPHSFTERIYTPDPFEYESGIFCNQVKDKNEYPGISTEYKLVAIDEYNEGPKIPNWCPCLK